MYESFGPLIRIQRERLGLSVDAASALLGVRPWQVMALEEGMDIRRELLDRVVRELGLGRHLPQMTHEDATQWVATMQLVCEEVAENREAWDALPLEDPGSELFLRVRESERLAAARFPDVAVVDAAALDRDVADQPELQPGITMRLLPHLRELLDRDPERVRELTAVLLLSTCDELRDQIVVLHARASSRTGRHAEAYATIAAAYEGFRGVPVPSTLELEIVEAEILHAWGRSEEALDLIRATAANLLLLYPGEGEAYAQAKALEARIDREICPIELESWTVEEPEVAERLKQVELRIEDERWLAGERLVHLAVTDAAALDRELAEHTELRPKMLLRLLEGLEEVLPHAPARVCDATAVLARHAGDRELRARILTLRARAMSVR